jgi:hypothetical protein
MRRIVLLALGLVVLGVAPPLRAFADSKSDEQDRQAAAQAEADKKKKQKEKDWDTTPAPLPAVKNAGPCPYVKVLYDAARYVELKDGVEKSEAVGWTGEIQKVRSACAYKGQEPINVQVGIAFAFGRGPLASGMSKTYHYWVAVTQRNKSVLDRKDFDVIAEFKPGQDRIQVNDILRGISIPRADGKVSGSNFEILIGFDVTPAMAAFNREGKRFRENVYAASAQGAPGTP